MCNTIFSFTPSSANRLVWQVRTFAYLNAASPGSDSDLLRETSFVVPMASGLCGNTWPRVIHHFLRPRAVPHWWGHEEQATTSDRMGHRSGPADLSTTYATRTVSHRNGDEVSPRMAVAWWEANRTMGVGFMAHYEAVYPTGINTWLEAVL